MVITGLVSCGIVRNGLGVAREQRTCRMRLARCFLEIIVPGANGGVL